MSIQTNSTVTFKGQPAIVKGNAKGWYEIEDARGVSHKVRAKEIAPTNLSLAPRKPPQQAAAVKVKDPNAPKAVRKIGKSVVRNFASYTKHKTATGNASYDNNDPVAAKLRGMDLSAIYAEASKVLGVTQKDLHTKYDHLNVGMQRMNLGNRIRGASKTADAAKLN